MNIEHLLKTFGKNKAQELIVICRWWYEAEVFVVSNRMLRFDSFNFFYAKKFRSFSLTVFSTIFN